MEVYRRHQLNTFAQHFPIQPVALHFDTLDGLVGAISSLSPDQATIIINDSPAMQAQLTSLLLADYPWAFKLLQFFSKSELPKLFYNELLLSIVLQQPMRMVFDSLMILLPDYDCGVLFAAPSLPGVFEVFLRTEEYLTEAQYLTFILIRNCTSQRLTIPTPLLVQVERVLDGVSSKFFDGAQSGYDALSNSPPFYFLVWSVVKLAQAGIFYDIVPICMNFESCRIVRETVHLYLPNCISYAPQALGCFLSNSGRSYLALDGQYLRNLYSVLQHCDSQDLAYLAHDDEFLADFAQYEGTELHDLIQILLCE
ncbi:hypothetical protein SS50377_22780 [Spironucleus salmonicida]|nr:hypothetical protein SS50377_22780 [Spironucleus salmonicida]